MFTLALAVLSSCSKHRKGRSVPCPTASASSSVMPISLAIGRFLPLGRVPHADDLALAGERVGGVLHLVGQHLAGDALNTGLGDRVVGAALGHEHAVGAVDAQRGAGVALAVGE